MDRGREGGGEEQDERARTAILQGVWPRQPTTAGTDEKRMKQTKMLKSRQTLAIS